MPRWLENGYKEMKTLGDKQFVLMIRWGDWKLTHEGLHKLVTCGDAKTGGKLTSWKDWKRIWPKKRTWTK